MIDSKKTQTEVIAAFATVKAFYPIHGKRRVCHLFVEEWTTSNESSVGL